METSITSETISQQTICGDPENIEITNDTEPKLTQSKEQMEIEQTRKNLMNAWEVYFKYLSPQRMACRKASVRWRVEDGGKSVAWSQPLTSRAGDQQNPQFGKTMKKVKKRKMWRFCPGTRALKEIRKFQKSTERLIPKIAFLWVVCELLQKESSWHRIQAGAILVLHEAAESYDLVVWRYELVHYTCQMSYNNAKGYETHPEDKGESSG